MSPESALTQIRAITNEDLATRANCRWNDCQCSTADCFECGYWHNCIHGPYARIREILSAVTP